MVYIVRPDGEDLVVTPFNFKDEIRRVKYFKLLLTGGAELHVNKYNVDAVLKHVVEGTLTTAPKPVTAAEITAIANDVVDYIHDVMEIRVTTK